MTCTNKCLKNNDRCTCVDKALENINQGRTNTLKQILKTLELISFTTILLLNYNKKCEEAAEQLISNLENINL